MYRFIYIGYFIVGIFIAYPLDKAYNFTDGPQNTASFIGNFSELLGLAIALTEIFVAGNLLSKMKRSIESLRSYSDLGVISTYINQISNDLIDNKYDRATIRLETVISIYQENLATAELQNINSQHRKNYDMINGIIHKSKLCTGTKQLSVKDKKDFTMFLTDFNRTIINMKITFKNTII